MFYYCVLFKKLGGVMIINHGISVCSMKVIGRKKNLADKQLCGLGSLVARHQCEHFKTRPFWIDVLFFQRSSAVVDGRDGSRHLDQRRNTLDLRHALES